MLRGLAFFDASTALGLFATDQMSWNGTHELRSTTDGGATWTPGIHSAGMRGEWTVERVVY